MAKEVIYLDIKDDVTSVIDKITKVNQKIIALVPPKQAGILQSAVNLRLLAKTAKAQAKVLVIITNQEALVRLSAMAGIPVAKTLTSKPNMPEIPALKVDGEDDIIDGTMLPIGELAGMPPAKSAAVKSDANKTDAAGLSTTSDTAVTSAKLVPAKIKVPNYDKFRKKMFLVGVGGVVLVSFLVWALVFAPRAEISFETTSRAINLSSSVSLVDKADKINLANNLIHAQTQTSTRKRAFEFAATGEKEIKTKAHGELIISKMQGTDPVRIPAGSVFTSKSGLKFHNVAEAVVPGAKYTNGGQVVPVPIRVAVQAVATGEQYNIAPQIYSHGFSDPIAVSGKQMSGGMEKAVKVVTQTDLDKAKEELIKDTHDNAIKELRNKFDSSMLIVNESLQIKEEEVVASSKVNEEAKDGKARLEQAINYRIMGISRKNLAAYLEHLVFKDSQNQQVKVYDPGLDEIKFADFVVGAERTSMRVMAQAKIGPKIDKDDVKRQVAGKTLGEIQSHYGSMEGVKEVRVDFSPFWVKSVPTNHQKITVIIKN